MPSILLANEPAHYSNLYDRCGQKINYAVPKAAGNHSGGDAKLQNNTGEFERSDAGQVHAQLIREKYTVNSGQKHSCFMDFKSECRLISLIRIAGLLVCTILALSACISTVSAEVLGQPGECASYKLAADLSERPEYERTNKLSVMSAQVQLGPEVKLADKSMAQWASLSFTRLNGQKYRMWILMSSWPNGKGEPKVSRYLWNEPQWTDALEFVHETTGAPVLPRLSLWEYGWPRTSSGDKPIYVSSNSGFPKEVQFQGWPFKLDKVDKGAAFDMPKKVTPVKINPDLMVATYNRYEDIEGRHYINIGKDNTYIETGEAEWKKHFDAGHNFHIGSATADWINRSGIYQGHWWWTPDITDWPAQLYRSNFWGRAVLVDEPVVHYRGWADQNATGALNPADSARDLEKWAIKHIWEESGLYSAHELGNVIKKTFGLGNLKLIERKYFTWEAFWESAWYEMAPKETTSGIVDEDINPRFLVESYNMAFGTQIPSTIENACTLKTAVVRGACRNFNKNWGTSIYPYHPNQLEPKSAQTTLRWMYNAGSTYFWFWTSEPGGGGHVPYPYQREFASTIRQAYKENPNRDMNALLHAAKVCIVLPYGYTFSPDKMQATKWLYLDRKASTGLTYRQILTNAALEAERCIRSGVTFDFAIDEPRFKPKGYEELVYIREDGSVKILRPGRGEQVLSQGRTPSRPDLGPMPQISIKVNQVPTSGPGEVKMTALAKPGTGELAINMYGSPMYKCEVLVTDDAGKMMDLIEQYTDTLSFDAKLDGNYRVRFSTADAFGRPALAETTFKISKSN